MAFNRQKQLEKIKDLNLEDDTHRRIDCLFCGKDRTLSVTKRGGFLLWHCFSASCDAKGSTEEALSIEQIKDILSNTVDNEITKPKYNFPEYFVEAARSQEALRYLDKYNCMEAYEKHKNRFYYDVTTHRAVFTIVHDGEIVGAVGRALNSSQQPKWWRYNDTPYPYVIGSSNTAVVVEDATSATNVSPFCTGIALLGTSLLDSHVEVIKKYKEVIVALDPDATLKSFNIQKVLSLYTNSRIAIIKDDLKYFKEDEAKKQLNIQ